MCSLAQGVVCWYSMYMYSHSQRTLRLCLCSQCDQSACYPRIATADWIHRMPMIYYIYIHPLHSIYVATLSCICKNVHNWHRDTIQYSIMVAHTRRGDGSLRDYIYVCYVCEFVFWRYETFMFSLFGFGSNISIVFGERKKRRLVACGSMNIHILFSHIHLSLSELNVGHIHAN